MITKTFTILLAVFLAFCTCDELIDDSELKEALPELETELEATDPSDPRFTFVTNSFSEFIRNLGFVNYAGGFLPGFYITFPSEKGKNVFLNSTTDAFPLAYTLAGAAMVAYVSAYLLSFIPLPSTGYGYSGDTELDLGLGNLGFGLQRDLSEYEDEYFPEVEAFEYEYPDSFYKAASEVQVKKVKPGKKKRKISKRTGTGSEEIQEKQLNEPGFFERIVNNIRNFFTPPTYRSSDLTLGGGFEQRLKRYENYWKRRRNGPNRRFSNSYRKRGRSEDTEPQMIGPKLSPHEERISSQKSEETSGAGSRFYTDRIAEVYDNYYSNS